MMKFVVALAFLVACVSAGRPISIFMYQWIPDPALDGWAGLINKLETQFLADTGNTVHLTYSFQYNVYHVSTIVECLTTGGFDMAEIDASNVQYLSENSVILPIPTSVDMSGFTQESLTMSRNAAGVLYMNPSYSCVNMLFSYDSDLEKVHDVEDLAEFIAERIEGHPEKIGIVMDLVNVWNLRLTYIDGHLDSFPHQPLYPNAYSANLKTSVVNGLKDLRDLCVDNLSSPHKNPCVDGTYFNDFGRYLGDFYSGRAVTFLGYPEYLNDFLEHNPSQFPTIVDAYMGDGQKAYAYTNGFAISAQNCDSSCMSTAISWMNWQKSNHALITSLGLDLTPPRPRYLMESWKPFYDLPEVQAYPQYKKFWKMQRKAIPLQHLNILQTQDAQYAALTNAIITGYTPP